MANIERNPCVSLLVDEYSDDWTKLRWLRVDGVARVVSTNAGPAAALTAKYPQYQHLDPVTRAIRIAIRRVRSWQAGEPFDGGGGVAETTTPADALASTRGS